MIEQDEKIIERAKERLSFSEQLQEQVTACRRLLSNAQLDNEINLCSLAVTELESLLWAELKQDLEYLENKEKLYTETQELYNQNEQDLYGKEIYSENYKVLLNGVRQQFRLLLIFIDKKELMPFN